MLLDLKNWVRDDDNEVTEPPAFGDMIITTGCRISEVVGHLTDPPKDAWWSFFTKGSHPLAQIRQREESENLRPTLNTDTMHAEAQGLSWRPRPDRQLPLRVRRPPLHRG